MGNASLVITNNASNGTATASSQELTMPASQVLSVQPSERWRSLSNTAWIVLDKGSAISADTVFLGGLTCGVNSTIRARCSTSDATGAAGDAYDSTALATGSMQFDVNYASFIAQLPAAASYRYLRFDITDPDATFVEAGCILDGLSEDFVYNFVPGAAIQRTDRSRVEKSSSGKTFSWPDNAFRTVTLSFDFINQTQRYGLIEQLDRKGLTSNILLMTDTDSSNMPRDSIFGLPTDLAPNTYGPIFGIFSKQLKIEERV